MSAALAADADPAAEVLVVEDDKDIRVLLERSLRRLGYEVRTAADGEAGLALALASPPSVILTDLRMPGMDGHTLLRRLATHGLSSAVVVMSAHGNMDDVVDVLRAGAVDYLKKPWTPTELAAAMNRATEIHEQRRLPAASAVAEAAPPASDGAPFALLLEDLKRGRFTLPSPARLIGELRALVGHPGASVQAVVDLVRQDPHLAAKVLRLSNSAEHGRVARNHDLHTAVVRIGINRLKGMVETIAAHDSYRLDNPVLQALQVRVWRYSIARAVAMRALARLAAPGLALDPEVAYSAGLLADLGASLLLWILSEHPPAGVGRPVGGDAAQVIVREHHAAIGRALVDWQKGEGSIAIVAGSHHDERAPTPSSALWSLAVAATEAADRLATDMTRPQDVSPVLLAHCRAELGIADGIIARVAEPLQAEFTGVLELLE
jgi:DNA-binding response OmpR family regulator